MNGEAQFEFATATRILFGAGKLAPAAPAAATLGRHALVVTGSTSDRAQKLLDSLSSEGLKSTIHSVSGEPKITDAQAGVECARQNNCDLVIAFGGGSGLWFLLDTPWQWSAAIGGLVLVALAALATWRDRDERADARFVGADRHRDV